MAVESRGATAERRIEAAVALAEALAPDTHRAIAALRRAINNGEPAEEALVEILAKARVLADLDWKTPADEVADEIGRLVALRRSPKLSAWRACAIDVDDMTTWETLERIGKELRPRGATLAALDDESDSYLVLVVPTAEVSRIRMLTRRVGFARLAVLDGRGLAKAVADREERLHPTKKRRATKRPSQPRKKLRSRDELYPWQNLEYVGGGSKKFWAVRVYPRALQITWGRIGTEGRWLDRSYERDGIAAQEAETLVAQKLRAGYVRASWRPHHFED